MKQELESLLATALEQRKEAYRKNCPKLFITAINAQIRDFTFRLAQVD